MRFESGTDVLTKGEYKEAVMRSEKANQSGSFPSRNRKVVHWKDADELHRVMHSLPGYFRALLLDFIDNPMTHKEFLESLNKLNLRMGKKEKRRFRKTDVKKDIDYAVECGVLEKKDGKYLLTPGGLKMAQFMEEIIPIFFGTILSA